RRAYTLDYSAGKIPPGVSMKATEPKFLDGEQQALRDGHFEMTKKAEGMNFSPGNTAALTMEAWTGLLTKPDGTVVPAIFRPSDGSPTFNTRMNNEISAHVANKVGVGDSVPVSVARSVEVGGKSYQGFIQEMGGVDLHSYLIKQAIAKYGDGS